ncbi:hypothetical protein [Sandaracinus amylolyticus]|uniref:hypothetical protein n=1 Tax=Sandaracinus amylolyticus TaxID=927083 RepID=UPI001F1EDACF|nr:hypothetical protein [Sandaracinus amylolyticus]UJR81094.1 Hypothetical protein I5071_31450 [Sandaracinus amylolyticus]
MRIAEILEGVPGARLATEADNDAIVRFYDRRAMGTAAFEVGYRRGPDFFALLRCQSDRHVVIVCESAGEIRGVGTITVRDGWAHGAPVKVAYLGDLRIAQDRRLLVSWRRAYGALVAHASEIEELDRASVFVTAVMDANTLARAALIERRGKGGPTYLPLAPFRMQSVLARWPLWPRPRLRDVRVRAATSGDREALEAFYESRQRARFAGFRGDFARRLRAWPGHAIERFVIAEDARSAIIGCVAPWSPSPAKETFVSRVPPHLARAGRVLEPWIRVPKDGETMKILYLTHLEAERPDVLRAMIDLVRERTRDERAHFVALPEYAQFALGDALRPYVVESVPITLYSVHAPGFDGAPIALDRAPGFEMALV